MSETKPSMPAQPKTIELPAMTDRALLEDMSRTVKEGFVRQDARADSQDERLDNIERQVDIAVQDGKDNNKRTTLLEVKIEEMQRRADTSSLRVKQPSQHDLEAQAALAQERAAREALAQKVDGVESKVVAVATKVDTLTTKTDVQTELLTDLKKLGTGLLKEHPTIASSLIGLFVAAIGAATAWFAARGH